jgi:hypothetical protein
MDAQAAVWFVLAIIAAFGGVRLLVERYVTKKRTAVQSRGGATLFAICMLIFAAGAFAAGLIAAS